MSRCEIEEGIVWSYYDQRLPRRQRTGPICSGPLRGNKAPRAGLMSFIEVVQNLYLLLHYVEQTEKNQRRNRWEDVKERKSQESVP